MPKLSGGRGLSAFMPTQNVASPLRKALKAWAKVARPKALVPSPSCTCAFAGAPELVCGADGGLAGDEERERRRRRGAAERGGQGGGQHDAADRDARRGGDGASG